MQGLRRQSGFTLFEILVVVFIVAIISGTAVLSIGVLGDDREVEREADRAIALFTILRDEAMLQGREFGIEFQRTGYRFVEYDVLGDRWADVPLDELLVTHTLPEGMEFELFIDGRGVKLNFEPARFTEGKDKDEDKDDEKADSRTFGVEQYSPHVFVYSSGDMTPFELHLVQPSNDTRLAFQFDVLGNTELIELEEL
jgi:general secretion pathway protein H